MSAHATRTEQRTGAFAAVADDAPVMLWMSRPDGWRTYFNRTWLEFTGRTLAEECGDGWTAGVHRDDRAAVLKTFADAARTGLPTMLEYRLRRADGEFRGVVDRAAPRTGKGGDSDGFIGCCIESTLRESTTLALLADEKRFRLLAENVQDMIYRYRVAHPRRTEYMSPAALAITGHRPEEFYTDPELTLKAIHPDDRHLVSQAFQHDPARLDTSILIRWIHPDGRIVFAEHRRVPIVDANGRLIAIEGVGRDVTERVDAERRIAESESRFRLLAENARDLIYRYKLAPFRCEYMSPAAVAITGYPPRDFYADPDFSRRVVHPDDRALIARARSDPRRLERPMLLRWVHPDGRVVYVEHRSTLVYDAKGEVIAFEGIGRDVTQSLANQDRLRESESQLRLLAASVEEAREKERALVARELHDELGQSLTAIKMELTRTARALMEQRLAPEAIDGLQSMIGTVDVATETVRRLATSLRPPALDHLGLVAAIELEAAALARRTGVRCRVVGNRRVTSLDQARSTTVFRIVQEALTNAIRHASASAIRISINSTARTTTLTIHDNGRGMTAEQIADPSAIGLVGMRERAELIGARLTVSSVSGKGTTVSMVMTPASDAAVDRPPV